MDGGQSDWETFATENADLFTWKPSILDTLYRPETISSDRARRIFVLPDKLSTASAV